MIGHADEAELLLRQLAALGGAVEEHRLAADLRHHDGLAAFHHAAGDSFAELVTHAIAGTVEAVGGLHLELAGVFVQHDDAAAHRAVMAAEHFEHAVQRGLQVDGAGQRLAGVQERGKAPDFVVRGAGGGRSGLGACG
jgi:hypothetical protein